MTASAHGDPVTLELTLDEAWVLHTGLLRHLKREAERENPAPEALSLLATLEHQTSPVVDADGLRLVRQVLVEYMADAPLRDRAACRSILGEVRAVLE